MLSGGHYLTVICRIFLTDVESRYQLSDDWLASSLVVRYRHSPTSSAVSESLLDTDRQTIGEMSENVRERWSEAHHGCQRTSSNVSQ